jgi:hypothetical protein
MYSPNTPVNERTADTSPPASMEGPEPSVAIISPSYQNQATVTIKSTTAVNIETKSQPQRMNNILSPSENGDYGTPMTSTPPVDGDYLKRSHSFNDIYYTPPNIENSSYSDCSDAEGISPVVTVYSSQKHSVRSPAGELFGGNSILPTYILSNSKYHNSITTPEVKADNWMDVVKNMFSTEKSSTSISQSPAVASTTASSNRKILTKSRSVGGIGASSPSSPRVSTTKKVLKSSNVEYYDIQGHHQNNDKESKSPKHFSENEINHSNSDVSTRRQRKAEVNIYKPTMSSAAKEAGITKNSTSPNAIVSSSTTSLKANKRIESDVRKLVKQKSSEMAHSDTSQLPSPQNDRLNKLSLAKELSSIPSPTNYASGRQSGYLKTNKSTNSVNSIQRVERGKSASYVRLQSPATTTSKVANSAESGTAPSNRISNKSAATPDSQISVSSSSTSQSSQAVTSPAESNTKDIKRNLIDDLIPESENAEIVSIRPFRNSVTTSTTNMPNDSGLKVRRSSLHDIAPVIVSFKEIEECAKKFNLILLEKYLLSDGTSLTSNNYRTILEGMVSCPSKDGDDGTSQYSMINSCITILLRKSQIDVRESELLQHATIPAVIQCLIFHGVSILTQQDKLYDSVSILSPKHQTDLFEMYKGSTHLNSPQYRNYFILSIIYGYGTLASYLLELGVVTINAEFATCLLKLCNFEKMLEPIETYEFLEKCGAQL